MSDKDWDLIYRVHLFGGKKKNLFALKKKNWTKKKKIFYKLAYKVTKGKKKKNDLKSFLNFILLI